MLGPTNQNCNISHSLTWEDDISVFSNPDNNMLQAQYRTDVTPNKTSSEIARDRAKCVEGEKRRDLRK